jgi:hypothetical protein
MQYGGSPVMVETGHEGFVYGAVTPIGQETGRGTGFLQGPDGSRAGIQWELSDDGPYIMRLEKPGHDHWGVYRLGFTSPVRTVADLRANLTALMPKLVILYSRIRVQ